LKHRLAAVGLVAGLAGGAVAGVAFGVPGVAGAERTTLLAATDPGPTTTAPASAPSTPASPAPADRTQWIKDALAPLVANGTITQAQADAIVGALEQAKPASPRGRGGPGGPHGRFGFGFALDAAADALGITPDELRTDLQNGQTIADIAKAKNLDVDTVIGKLVDKAKAELDQRVADGKMTQAQADQALAQARTMITDAVNGKLPTPPGLPGDGKGRRRGPAAPTPSTSPSTPSTPSSTAPPTTPAPSSDTTATTAAS
jgi:hypothetical protein